jgi:hypothetical protein
MLAGMGSGDLGDWAYPNIESRVNNDFISVNSGDIVLLANVREGFQFGEPYSSQHGTLTLKHGVVPVACGFMGTKSQAQPGDLLDPIRTFLGTPSATPVQQMLETPSILRFFGVSP